MKPSTIALILTLLIISAFTLSAVTWQVKDDNYEIKFDARGASGAFKGLKRVIVFDETHLAESKFNVSVDVNTINTGNSLKNRHARAEGFFNVEKYPTIQYTSSKITKIASGFEVTGNLKIKATVKPVTIPFTFDKRENEGTFRGKFEIDREDFDLVKFGVGKTIKIEIAVPVKKAK